MNAYPNLVVLFCLVGFGISVTESTVAPLTTPNPECPGMHRIAKSLEKGLASYTKEVTNCRVNNACTGLMCNGTHEKNDFYMKLELKHCKTPPAIHLDLIYKKINIHQEMHEDQRIQISSKKGHLVPIPIKLKLTLKRNRNKITTGLEVQLCPLQQCKTLFTLLQPTTFCVNMKTCPGYNSTGDVPCHLNPTTIPTRESAEPLKTASTAKNTAKSSSSTLKPRPYSPTRHSEPLKTASTAKITAKSSSSTLKPRPYSPTRHSEPVKTASTAKVTAKVTSSTLKPRTYSPTRHSGTTAGPGDTSALKKGSGGHHGISTGLAIGVAFACIVGILVIIGAVIYWKKFYRRSRLRAAYYNDISMNDPLYEDFGPEVA